MRYDSKFINCFFTIHTMYKADSFVKESALI